MVSLWETIIGQQLYISRYSDYI